MAINSAGRATWVVEPAGCPTTSFDPGKPTSTTCSESRGGLFNDTRSTTWSQLGNFSLGPGTTSRLESLNATYGLDTVSLGFGGDIGGPSLESQVVVPLATHDFYMGIFGLNHQATNLTDFSNPHTSFLTTLKQRDLIPSLSWAYTAGAHYRKLEPLLCSEFSFKKDQNALPCQRYSSLLLDSIFNELTLTPSHKTNAPIFRYLSSNAQRSLSLFGLYASF